MKRKHNNAQSCQGTTCTYKSLKSPPKLRRHPRAGLTPPPPFQKVTRTLLNKNKTYPAGHCVNGLSLTPETGSNNILKGTLKPNLETFTGRNLGWESTTWWAMNAREAWRRWGEQGERQASKNLRLMENPSTRQAGRQTKWCAIRHIFYHTPSSGHYTLLFNLSSVPPFYA
jgi:hypothetical protein